MTNLATLAIAVRKAPADEIEAYAVQHEMYWSVPPAHMFRSLPLEQRMKLAGVAIQALRDLQAGK